MTTYTDAIGLVHSVRGTSCITGCDQEVPLRFDKTPEAALVQPYPRKFDKGPRRVTCLECIVMEDA